MLELRGAREHGGKPQIWAQAGSPPGVGGRRTGYKHPSDPDPDPDCHWSLQVPLPSSVFINTTESCEVERLAPSPSFSKSLFLRTCSPQPFCPPHLPWCWAVAGTGTRPRGR